MNALKASVLLLVVCSQYLLPYSICLRHNIPNPEIVALVIWGLLVGIAGLAIFILVKCVK